MMSSLTCPADDACKVSISERPKAGIIAVFVDRRKRTVIDADWIRHPHEDEDGNQIYIYHRMFRRESGGAAIVQAVKRLLDMPEDLSEEPFVET
jgi:hypothetical protein